ncbi:hypothetical protein IEQ34_001439 [Dendrobium chrysotoxum]|uniref:DUF4220 domain-containing protein n=1 Tax=Dendrobium chrysotoxum TaxID=161865 RepID=A0AAV7HMN1_DENCH|nr:hypothetical protein IEQ34_001439 [Dendrobium chrysotoxum]
MEISPKYKQLWNKWDVRVLILLSLSIQIILIFLGRLRRTSTSRWIRLVVWASYLLADRVAGFVLGQLSSSMDGSSSNIIIAFWAPFLILHLGGPDTITAYSIEDNELWARHLLGLGYDLFIAFYVYFRSLPNTRLLIPTLLIFLVAIIKYVERSYSLYKASVKGIHNSISSFNITINDLTNAFERLLQRNNLKYLHQAFLLYSNIKPYFIDAFQNLNENGEIENFLENMSAEQALMVMRTELNYAYDEFYTKAIVIHSIPGYVLRVLCSTCILVAFSLFVLEPKDDFNNLDVDITYVLLTTSICLDFIATIMLMFSDRMIVSLLNVKKLSNFSNWLANFIFRIKNTCRKGKYWSIKLPQLNLLIYCLSFSSPKKTLRQRMMSWVAKKLSFMQAKSWLYRTSFIEQETYTLQTMSPVKAPQEFLEIIISNLQRLEHLSLEDFNKPAGFSALQKVSTFTSLDNAVPFVQLLKTLSFDQQVLIWHITTELCLHGNLKSQHPWHPQRNEIEENTSKGLKIKSSEMEACKYLSNYMMHTVLIRSDLLSTMGGESYMLFWETIKEMIEFIGMSYDDQHQLLKPNEKVEEVCMKMIATPIEFNNFTASLFNSARVLAHLMLTTREEERWTVITMEWVELLQKGANKTKGRHI